MMKWQEHEEFEGEMIYAKVSEDGLIRLTAIKGYPELDAYLEWVEAGNNPDEFWSQFEDFITLSEGNEPEGK